MDQSQLSKVSQVVNEVLAGSTSEDRAILLEHVARVVYDHVKFRDPEGGGLDGRDGPERQALGDVLNVVIGHADKERARQSR